MPESVVTAVWDCTRLADWAAYVQTHPQATLYHDPAWLRVMQSSFPYKLRLLVALSGNLLVGGVPLLEVRSPWSRRLVAVPFRDRGGMLWSSGPAFAALTRAAAELMRERRCSGVVFKSLQPYPPDLWGATPLHEQFHWVNSRIELSHLNEELLLQQVGSKTRNMLRQAEKAGLTWEDASHHPTAVEDFYRLHLLSQRQLGLPPFPVHFFAHQRLHLGAAWRLFMVRNRARPVAATVVFLWRQQAIYAYSCSDPAARQLRPNDMLIMGALRWLLARPYSVFDLGSDSPHQEGLLFFKRKWRAIQQACPLYGLGAPQTQDSSSPTYRLARSAFQRFPLWLLQITSHWTHWFG